MLKILIADDETDMRDRLVKYITGEDRDVTVVGSVSNGKDALEAALKYSPDIVLADINMPVMNGLDFLKEAYRQNLSMKAIIISGYDEFEYAKEAISLGVSDYLVKPFSPEELKNVIDKLKTEIEKQQMFVGNLDKLKKQADLSGLLLKEKVIKDIVSGEQTYLQTAADVIDTTEDYYCICDMKIFQDTGEKTLDLSNLENSAEILDLMREGYLTSGVYADGTGLSRKEMVIILGGKAGSSQEFRNRIKSGIKHFLDSMKKYYGFRIVCILGKSCADWRDLHGSYQDTVTAWRDIVNVEQNMIDCEEAGESEEEKLSADASSGIIDSKKQILISIRMGQKENVRSEIDKLMKLYALQSGRKSGYAAISVNELVYTIAEELEGGELSGNRAQLEEVFRKTEKALSGASFMEIKEILTGYTEACIDLVNQNSEQFKAEQVSENVRKIIEENLKTEGLTLEWLSERMHFSPNYIRQIFKQKTGESFMEYVIRKRMERAANLLINTDLQIQEVAEECGYSNQRYFSSSFRKFYDCTPSSFKSMAERQKGEENV